MEKKCNMSRHYKLQQPNKEASLWQSPTYSTQRSRSVGAAHRAWNSRVPLDEGQASLGEALMIVHTCRLLLQARRHLGKSRVYMSPQAQKVWGSPWCLWFPIFNIVYIMKLLPKTLHCKLYYLHCLLGENSKHKWRF